MIELQVRLGERSYPVRIGPWRDWGLRSLVKGWPAQSWGLVADRKVWEVWSKDLLSCLDAAHIEVRVLELDGGETAKDLTTLRRIYDHLLSQKIRRDGTLAVFGGGVLGDLAGFAAATWLRGIRLVQIPTTLMSQVDSSVGGKNGLNFGQYKNLIGSYHQPDAVLISPEWLNSLPPRDFASGLAEVMKCGIIRDPELLRLLEEEDPVRLSRSAGLEEVVARALVVKARIVEQDERELGLRRLLNFGHTVGHALESATGFERLLHGEAVALGLIAGLHLSVAVCGLDPQELERMEELLRRYGLPVRIGSLDPEAILSRLDMDKKTRSGQQVWVLTERLGTATVASQVSYEKVRNAVEYILIP
jgi:3-dehydroquinate synthase